MRRTKLAILLLASLAVVAACGDDDGTGAGGGAGGGSGVGGGAGGGTGAGGGDGGPGTGGGAGGGTGGGCVPILCPDGSSVPYQCGDCIDNDDDGDMDTGGDPDCLGPCHNNESGFDIGLTGQPETQCSVDCYYDSNSGKSECNSSWTCDPLEPRLPDAASCDYTPSNSTVQGLTCDELMATHDDVIDVVTGQEECDTCRGLTPPGCDCFGCCEIPSRSGNFVFIGTQDPSDPSIKTCNYAEALSEYDATLTTPEERLAALAQADRQCALCTPQPTCQTVCVKEDPCQRCFGDTDPLPPECEEQSCPNGGSPCVGNEDCVTGEFCSFGCCTWTIPPPG